VEGGDPKQSSRRAGGKRDMAASGRPQRSPPSDFKKRGGYGSTEKKVRGRRWKTKGKKIRTVRVRPAVYGWLKVINSKGGTLLGVGCLGQLSSKGNYRAEGEGNGCPLSVRGGRRPTKRIRHAVKTRKSDSTSRIGKGKLPRSPVNSPVFSKRKIKP